MPDERLTLALYAYVLAFRRMPSRPSGAADDYLAGVLEVAVNAGDPGPVGLHYGRPYLRIEK